MRFRSPKNMAAISMDPRCNHYHHHQQHGSGGATAASAAVVEEIEGLIRVSKDEIVERPAIMPIVPCSSSVDVTSKDVYIDKLNNLWARIYVPNKAAEPSQLPLVVYFHGGGFCVGSAAWSCYHDFLTVVASKAGCVVVSVNYRLAPENRLPAAYEDGLAALLWIKQQAINPSSENRFWLSKCNAASLFLAGDSAGANIAYHVTARSKNAIMGPLRAKGLVLIQPFFSGEVRTASERHSAQPRGSALTLAASDAYWRLALPPGSGRDHPWCNPLAAGGPGSLCEAVRVPSVMVCVAEMDILRDRNVELCNALAGAGKRVSMVMCRGVGHAFQVLNNSPFSQARTQELVSHIKTFVSQ